MRAQVLLRMMGLVIAGLLLWAWASSPKAVASEWDRDQEILVNAHVSMDTAPRPDVAPDSSSKSASRELVVATEVAEVAITVLLHGPDLERAAGCHVELLSFDGDGAKRAESRATTSVTFESDDGRVVRRRAPLMATRSSGDEAAPAGFLPTDFRDPIAMGFTGTDGVFRCEIAINTPVLVRVSRAEYADGLLLKDPGQRNVTVILQKGRAIAGRLVLSDDRSRPANGVHLALYGIAKEGCWHVTTGPDGRWQTCVGADKVVPYIAAPNSLSIDWPVRALSVGLDQDRELLCSRMPRIRVSSATTGLPVVKYRLDVIESSGGGLLATSHADCDDGVTSLLDSYGLHVVRRKVCRANVRAAGYEEYWSDPIRVGQDTDIDARLAPEVPPRDIRLRIVDTHGAAVASALVRLSRCQPRLLEAESAWSHFTDGSSLKIVAGEAIVDVLTGLNRGRANVSSIDYGEITVTAREGTVTVTSGVPWAELGAVSAQVECEDGFHSRGGLTVGSREHRFVTGPGIAMIRVLDRRGVMVGDPVKVQVSEGTHHQVGFVPPERALAKLRLLVNGHPPGSGWSVRASIAEPVWIQVAPDGSTEVLARSGDTIAAKHKDGWEYLCTTTRLGGHLVIVVSDHHSRDCSLLWELDETGPLRGAQLSVERLGRKGPSVIGRTSEEGVALVDRRWWSREYIWLIEHRSIGTMMLMPTSGIEQGGGSTTVRLPLDRSGTPIVGVSGTVSGDGISSVAVFASISCKAGLCGVAAGRYQAQVEWRDKSFRLEHEKRESTIWLLDNHGELQLFHYPSSYTEGQTSYRINVGR